MESADSGHRFYRGCVAMLDVLGARSLWRDLGSYETIHAFRHLTQSPDRITAIAQALHESGAPQAGSPELERKVRFFSDTVVITSIDRSGSLSKDEVYLSSLHDVIIHTRSLIRAAALLPFPLNKIGSYRPDHPLLGGDPNAVVDYPLAYRGCIAIGELLVSDPFFVGPAINAAADIYEKLDCAVVCMDEHSAKVYAERLRGRDADLDSMLLEYEVPMKPCGALSSYAVNYLVCSTLTDPQRVQENILKSFSRDAPMTEDVRRKQENTRAFLQKATEAVAARGK